MATVTETQDLLDELAGMTLCSRDDLKIWTKQTAVIVKGYGQQLALLRGLVHDAEDEEPTTEVRGKMEAVVQQVNAQVRLLDRIASDVRDVRTSLRSLDRQGAELRALAVEAGYDG
jgi:hypothetical protein